MKHLLFFINFLFLSSSIAAQGSARQLDNFTELRANENVTVELVSGKANTAMVKVSTGDESDVLTKVENGILRIKWKKNIDSNNRTATIQLSYNQLNALVANAGARISSKELIKTNELSLDASSGSKIKLEIECNSLESESTSGASISVTGNANSQKVEVNSGASYKAHDLITETTIIEVSSGASAKVHATKNLTAEASTGASIKYAGNPSNKEIEENFYSGGSVKASK